MKNNTPKRLSAQQERAKTRQRAEAATGKLKALPPGHHTVVVDPEGNVRLGFGMRGRVIDSKPDRKA